MKCCGCDTKDTGGFVPCTKEGEFCIWCPTWYNASKGPSTFCREHSNVFRPEINPNAADGLFFWGDEANDAFQSVHMFYFHDDKRILNILGMMENGHKLNKRASIVDGKLWYAARWGSVLNHVMLVGDYCDQKERFEKLLMPD